MESNSLFQFESKIGWAEILAILAFGIALLSYFQSRRATADSRALAHLDLEPKVRITTKLSEAPASFTIHNDGPVGIVQAQVTLLFLNLKADSREAARVGWGSPQTVGAIEAKKSFSVPIDLEHVTRSLELPKEDWQWPQLFELTVEYRRKVDLRLYTKRAFLTLNPDGRVVGEFDNSLPKAVYRPLFEAAHSTSPPWMPGWDDSRPSKNSNHHD